MKFLLILFIFLSACSQKKQAQCEADKLYSDYYEWLMESFPTYASAKGWGERHNTFFQNTVTNLNKIQDERKDFLSKISDLMDYKECEDQKINLSLLKSNIKDDVDEFKFETYYIQFQSMGGPHTWLPQLYKRVPLKTLQNYKDYLERMSKIPTVFNQARKMSLIGLEKGITPPQITFKNYETSILDMASGQAEKSPYYAPFLKISDDISLDDQKKLKAEAKKIILQELQPAYKELHTFWVKSYYPNLRTSIAASDLPQGEEFYEFQIKKMTTLKLTAKEIHEKGKSEVSRILNEMKSIQKKVGFKGEFKDFIKHLRTNPKFYAKTPEELMSKTAVILKTIDGKLPKLFKTLPMLPYGLEPIPDFIAHKSPAAYYMRGDIKIGKAGTYQLNLSELKSRPLYNLVALSLHEAVPGHHLQIALAQELKDIPEFRKESGPTAFVEGWGLYSESLGKLVGMYEDPYDDFGRLNYEQWRALRLVVDTGLHAFGWSRDRAIDYMKENSGLSEKNIITEVDRYINWPGQALAYKMGELKIQELKRKSKEALNDKFDIRDFHDVVLKEGAIPLPLLEKNVDAYILKTKEAI